MHTNFKLNFHHEINFQVFQDNADPTVAIEVNGKTVFDETFQRNVLHTRSAKFYFEYDDCTKNCLRIIFSGPCESSNRYVKMKGLSVNETYLNMLNCYYNPILNPDWWDNLDEQDKIEIKSRIYANNAGEFGWYGSWDYYFNSGVDWSSKYKGVPEDKDLVVGIRPIWVTLAKNTVTNPWHGKKDD